MIDSSRKAAMASLTLTNLDQTSPESILAEARKDAKVNIAMNSQRKRHQMSIDGTLAMSGVHETEHTRAMTLKDPSPFD